MNPLALLAWAILLYVVAEVAIAVVIEVGRAIMAWIEPAVFTLVMICAVIYILYAGPRLMRDTKTLAELTKTLLDDTKRPTY